MPDYCTVSELARQLNCRPRDISDLFYRRVLDDKRCPIVSGRRMIPTDYIPTIKEAIQAKERPAL